MSNEILKIKTEIHNAIFIFYIHLRAEGSSCVSSHPTKIS